jgi:hypothetical protein
LQKHDIPHFATVVDDVGLLYERIGIEHVYGILGLWVAEEGGTLTSVFPALRKPTGNIIPKMDLPDFVAHPPLPRFFELTDMDRMWRLHLGDWRDCGCLL